jgi:deoxycytidylate deaminase
MASPTAPGNNVDEEYFMALALLSAHRSKDPKRQVSKV